MWQRTATMSRTHSSGTRQRGRGAGGRGQSARRAQQHRTPHDALQRRTHRHPTPGRVRVADLQVIDLHLLLLGGALQRVHALGLLQQLALVAEKRRTAQVGEPLLHPDQLLSGQPQLRLWAHTPPTHPSHPITRARHGVGHGRADTFPPPLQYPPPPLDRNLWARVHSERALPRVMIPGT